MNDESESPFLKIECDLWLGYLSNAEIAAKYQIPLESVQYIWNRMVQDSPEMFE
jgi:hypothetical protein